MLCYGRLAGQLSRITRRATSYPVYLKSTGYNKTISSKFSSKSKKERTGSTAKVEECVPTKSKTQKKVPPLPPVPPPPPPPIYSTAPSATKSTPESQVPLCEDQNYKCPANCTPIAQEDCSRPGDGSDGKGSEFKYWKHLIAALVLTGVSVTYAYFKYFQKDEKDGKDEIKVINRGKGRKKIAPNPVEPDDIPSEVPYLLIGGGTAAFSAFRSIKTHDPKAKVLVVTNEGDLPYMRPPLSKDLWFQDDDDLVNQLIFWQWNGTKRSLYYQPKEFFLKTNELMESEKGGIAVATGWTINKIDAYNKTAYLQNGRPIKYDKCLIATGASPKNLSTFESASKEIKEKVIVYRTKEDFEELFYNIKKPEVENIVIVGGGFLGSELSISLAQNLTPKGKKVYQVYKEKSILAQVLPEYLSQWTTKHLIKHGVICIPNVEVHDCIMKNNRLSLTLSDGKILEADQVVVAIGVDANTALAKESNLETHPEQGGFLVNAELEARRDLWVAGDAACFFDVQLGRRRIEHHDHAVVSGRLAGENMTGAKKPYLHQSMLWSDLGPDIGFEAIGIIDSNLETVGVFAKDSENDKPKVDVTASDNDVKAYEKENTNDSDEKSEPSNEDAKSNSNQKSVVVVENKSETNEITKPVQDKKKSEDFEKGVVFYLKQNTVVGIVLWNITDRMRIARQLLRRGTTYDEINDASKLLQIHED